ncbi:MULTISPECIES: 1-aminocyclopropane-1-carboxylate deaminase/D-cysteine desulfhydrase [unclassified Acinetobacter]|uniref:1-aminocyclopropane-1-carboxylate deaminase/D-cysteine desulfhydrase n=1 Tax=unclassified Acinetobacter TaxID=196816 RepID=UPI002935136F|nr:MULTISPECIES: pyridoxal-phosphate dependent enzyme [unclassified Acinetobacter]WOE32824.1 pyridoxal-phosphate dependent enzyme [Acinetobacter sp. SAAs470]WOE38301.1 pyridoxal-phosphate dependent enzyme [Acinetobacter sp. SAAs474]
MISLNSEQDFNHIAHDIPYQQIEYRDVQLSIKRLDLIHPYISGNKFFKLKYNIIHAKKLGYKGILSFGGAYSNHIAAIAYTAQLFGLKSLGMIRGEELAQRPLNPTLQQASRQGMALCFISRAQYRQKDHHLFLQQLQQQYPDFYIIPEGGCNTLAIQGCQEILTDTDRQQFKTICCAVGTGGTMTGLIKATQAQHYILGFSALKGCFLNQDIQQYTQATHWRITDAYCCGGYGKTTPQLFKFIREFEDKYTIPLEQVYTGKMLMGVFDLIEQGQLNNDDQLLIIHSGGLQGRSPQLNLPDAFSV